MMTAIGTPETSKLNDWFLLTRKVSVFLGDLTKHRKTSNKEIPLRNSDFDLEIATIYLSNVSVCFCHNPRVNYTGLIRKFRSHRTPLQNAIVQFDLLIINCRFVCHVSFLNGIRLIDTHTILIYI